jgi:hypothetical protein
MSIKLLEVIPRNEDDIYKNIIKTIEESDGFLVLTRKDGVLKKHVFSMNVEEMIYSIETAKIQIINNDW